MLSNIMITRQIKKSNIMKKQYIAPTATQFTIACEGLVAASLNYGNKKPTGDDDDNFFSNFRDGEWDDEEEDI